MAQFDVHRVDGVLVVDCQSDLLASLNTRVVIPLLERDAGLKPATRLNPVLDVEGSPYVMATQFIATVPAQLLGSAIASLAARNIEIIGAMDFLLTGV